MDERREARIAELVGAVARQALADWGAERVALLDDGSPEAELAARLLEPVLGAERVARVGAGAEEVELLLHTPGAELPAARVAEEVRRLRARLLPGSLPASPANKTALLLGGPLPPEALLPLGDLYAGEVRALAGGWSAPAEVRALAERAGGVERLDAALREWLERRDPDGLALLPEAARGEVRRAFERGRASRLAARTVPKLGYRTLGVDLFE